MPRGDGTGPMGYGPLTGRRMGYCAGFDMPGFAYGAGFGMGRGRGGGRAMAWRRGFGGWGFPAAYPVPGPIAQAPDSNQLKAQIDALEQSLTVLKQQLEAMEKSSE
ncbi:DUF5320 domain-containing protein [Syntrophotalea acetylenica]|uniref:Uncharacterized protein n=1 Tax=Syntrophotalea acetylenica TaxID=29542 RepID=A0A1L3GDZ8_SYNAC|nr:DUF5320 domain-containing protein [Syntrophotalea acetylenica]APG24045.1 hypothetical protein A7E75_02650 [Syntrophotalea acetylenica]APG44629.1 hypothetical protein A6070_11275 [Syntrophotalea acetylenica]MDY0261947.1 DUF5320 domain-containing protein [Syntrophotalea acetylenica]